MSARDYKNLRCEKVSDHAAILEINRPEILNAMPFDFLLEAHRGLDDLEQDLSVRAVVFTARGEKSFSAGGDLREERASALSDHARLLRYNELGSRLCLKIMNSRLPFIAAVNGYAFGAPLAVIGACDLSLAADNAVFGLPTCALGGIPGWGCTQIVARRIGVHQVNRMLLLNERFDAEEARRVGLVSRVVPANELRPTALALAERLAASPPATLAAAKLAVNGGLDVSGSLAEGLALEHECLRACNVYPAFAEGISAFLEKRAPDFASVDDPEKRKILYARLKALKTGGRKYDICAN